MRSFIMRLGAVPMTAFLALGLLSAPAHAEPATLAGTLTSDATGEPVSGCVTVYDTDFGYVTSACTDESGTWSVDVEAGTAYKVEVSAYDGRHIGEWAQDATSFEDAHVVTAPATLAVGLQVGGTIGGTLHRADGSPAEGASVTVLRAADLSPVAWTNVFVGPPAGEAEWSALVAPGDYVVEYWDNGAHQYAVGQTSAEAATRFAVTADASTRADDRFLAAATVRGTIVSDVTGEPVEGACATILTAADNRDDAWWAGEGCTGPDGTYEVELSEPGTYVAQFTDPAGSFVGEYSGDTRDFAGAQTFDVSRAEPAVVDASLAAASVIVGRAVDAKTGAPIENACPNAYSGNTGGYVHGAVSECSGADGGWKLKGLGAGSYAVSVDVNEEPRSYTTTWAFKATSQETATLITVGAGTTKAVRDVQLMPGGTVTGTITGPTGEPAADAWVVIDQGYPGRAGPGEGRYTARTDEHGRYTITGVPPGSRTAFVYSSFWGSLAPEWSGDSVTRTAAAELKVKALKSVTFDASLSKASRISGTVVDAAGEPVTDNMIGLIYNADGDYIGDFEVYGGDNDFTSTALPAGAFTLELQTESGESFWFDGVTRDSGHTALSLAVGEQKAVTFRLP